MTATAFGRVLFVSIIAALVVVGGYGTWWTHNVATAAGNAVGTGFVVLGVVPAPKLAQPVAWHTVNRTMKADREYDEAPADLADAEPTTFTTRYAALEK